MVLRQLDRHTQKNEVGVLPYTTQKTNSKWIRDRIVRGDMIKLLEENRGINLQDLRLGKAFLGVTSKAQVTKNKMMHFQQNENLLC